MPARFGRKSPRYIVRGASSEQINEIQTRVRVEISRGIELVEPRSSHMFVLLAAKLEPDKESLIFRAIGYTDYGRGLLEMQFCAQKGTSLARKEIYQ